MKLTNTIFFVQDINKSLDFYQKIGFKVAEHVEKSANLKTGEEEIFLTITEPKNGRELPGKQACTFANKNVEGLYEKLKMLSTPLAEELRDLPDGKTFAISDPDGNKINFTQSR